MVRYPDFLTRLDLAPGADERQVRRAYARELKRIDQQNDLAGFQYLRECYETALAWAQDNALNDPQDRTDASTFAVAAGVHADVEAHAGAPALLPTQAAPPHVPPASPPAQSPPAPSPADTSSYAVPPTSPPSSEQAPAAAAPPMLRALHSAPADPDQIAPARLGAAVFADFVKRIPALTVLPDRTSRDDAQRIAPWNAALREALADPRLLHLDARVDFEGRIAALLADGWRPGHHLLLAAAIEVFGWDRERRVLERLGHAGMALDAALEQRAVFQTQDIKARMQQRDVLDLLRQPQLPGKRTLRRHAASLVLMMAHFPNLLPMVAPHAAAVAWRAEVSDAILAAHPAAGTADLRPWWRRSIGKGIRVILVISIVLRVLVAVLKYEAPHPTVPGQEAPAGWLGDVAQRERLRHPKPIYEDEPVTPERIEAIRARIRYRPGKDVAPGEQAVRFQIVLDADGSILGLNKLQIPSDPAYAAAVEQAIRSTGPFPPKTAKSVVLGFHVDVKRRSFATPPAPAFKAPLPAPWVAAPPGRTSAPPKPKGEPVSEVRMAYIRDHIQYRPAKGVADEQRARFQVVLDADGAIVGMSAIEAPTDPAYADAVERAIRAGGPFPANTMKTFTIGFHTIVKPPLDGSPPPQPPPALPPAPSSPSQ